MAVASDQDSSEDQIKCPHVADCLTTSAWVCLIVLQNSATGPEKQLTKAYTGYCDKSRKAHEGILLSHSHTIV